ncbi:COP23 domain-containing protein [Tumidithrix elongata RA019]|uniref:COP23 domain-containing protein n=1 Tax=Tumidithrix elongata BACA0141 TaxID=2716417 RepID=A0AAW9Q442_9CYAN|nr:COP23 domain-containing protein [Tumidithrix elongata RA019]
MSLAVPLAIAPVANPALAQFIPVETDPASTSPSTSPNTTQPSSQTAANSGSLDQRFYCQNNGGQYVVMYQPKSQPGKFYAWAAPAAMGDGWSPERRCAEISRRLESYRPDGLVEMRTSTENGYNVICATTEKNTACRIVLTVPVGQDPISTRDRVFANLSTADTGQSTTAVNTYVGGNRGRTAVHSGEIDLSSISNVLSTVLSTNRGSSRTTSYPSYPAPTNYPAPTSYRDGIYLKPFLDPSDGGTGSALVGNASPSNGRRFNRGNFLR